MIPLAYTLLGTGVVVVLIGAAGAAVHADAFDRLHGAGLVATPGAVLIVLGALVAAPSGLFAAKSALLLIVVLLTGPTLTHATAQALRVRRLGEFRIAPEELADEGQRARRTGRDDAGREERP